MSPPDDPRVDELGPNADMPPESDANDLPAAGHPHERDPAAAVQLFWKSSGTTLPIDDEPITVEEQRQAAQAFYQQLPKAFGI